MSGTGLKIALAASLALNLFVIGAVVGAVGMRARLERQQVAPAGNPLMRAGDALPPDAQRAYRQQLRQTAVASQPKLAEARQARLEAARLMAQPDFDAAAVADALSRAREAELQARQGLEDAVVSFAAGAEPAQRRVLAKGLDEPPGRGGGRGAGRGGRDGRSFGPPLGGPSSPPK